MSTAYATLCHYLGSQQNHSISLSVISQSLIDAVFKQCCHFNKICNLYHVMNLHTWGFQVNSAEDKTEEGLNLMAA